MALWDDADIHVLRGPSQSFSDPAPGQSDEPVATIGHIGRYALKHKLGEGGIGTVYAAHDPLLSRLIAVKTLHVEVEDSERESFNALFLNEARAAGGLSHPHIVTVFDAGISDNRAYIAMELLKGRDLRQLREEGWRATPPQAVLVVRRVADALGYAHSKGVVHRDIKPANIFMVGRTQPRVLDFGIARVAHRHDGHSINGDIVAGSPYYMAPEQARNEPVDRRADVFSLGVVLYELLTNEKPFKGSTLEEITTAVLKHDPMPVHLVDPSVPEALSEITAKAIAKNPEHRYRSARAFSRELRHWLEENTTTSEGDVNVAQANPLTKWWITAASVGVLSLCGIAWAMLWPHRATTPNQSTMAVAASRKSADVPTTAAAAAAIVSSNPPPASTAVTADSTTSQASTPIVPAATNGTPKQPIESTASVNANAPTNAATSAATSVALTAALAAPPAAGQIAPPANVASAPPAVAKTVKDAAKAPVKETAKERRVREARERDARNAAAINAAPAAPAATGLVRIAISPWGDVEVDGKPAGTSPPLTEITLSQGRHQIIIRNTDLPPQTMVVNVTADQPVTVKHKF
jgi:serine/threonine protein kinase